MCLVFRAMLVASLHWLCIPVIAQEKQSVSVPNSSVIPQNNSINQAQQPPQNQLPQDLKTAEKPIESQTQSTNTPQQSAADQQKSTQTSDQQKVTETTKVTTTTTTPEAVTKTEKTTTTTVPTPATPTSTDTTKPSVAETDKTKTVSEETKTTQSVAATPTPAPVKKPEETTGEPKQAPISKPEEQKKEEEPKKVEQPQEENKKTEVITKEEVTKIEKPVQAKEEQPKKMEEISEEIKRESEELQEQESKKPEENKPSILNTEEGYIEGIDTVNLEEPRGNWLFKKIWWGRAESKYEKIRTVFENILESRIVFFTKRSTVDRDLFAPFYFEIGMSNGELQDIVSQLMTHIERERKREGELSPTSKRVVDTLISEKKSLESISASVIAVNKLDLDIDETLKKLMEQIDRARRYEQDAWKNFKDIGRVLSDKKARELYYQMDTAYNNIKDIQEYVGQALIVHLDRLVGAAKNQTEKIKTNIDGMKKKGHDLRNLVDQISNKIENKPAPVEETEEQETEEQEEQGFFGSIFSTVKSGIVSVWDSVVYIVTLPFSWFWSSEPAEQSE
jgi:hypothetical protein